MGKLRQATHLMLRENGEEWFKDVLEKVACGETVTAICRQQNLTIGPVMMWIDFVPERRRAYEKALQLFAESRAHQSVDEADSATIDNWQVAKLRVDTNMRIAGKWDRERYGEKTQQVTNNTVILGDATAKAAQALLAKMTGPTQDSNLVIKQEIDVTPEVSRGT